MIWDGKDRRATAASRADVRQGMLVLAVLLVALFFFATAYINGQRQADVVNIACGNAVGHHDLTEAVLEAARVQERVARELGLQVAPVSITVPEVPPECSEF